MIKKIELCYATINHVKFLFELFNDRLTRKNALKSEKISFVDHKNWFTNRLKNLPKIFIFKKDKKLFGQVRFEKIKDNYEIDYSVSKTFRGKGLSKLMLLKAILKGPTGRYVGKVKKNNKISKKVFESLNFKLEKRKKKYFIYTFLKEKNFKIKKKIFGRRIYLKKLEEKNATKKYLSWFKDPLIKQYINSNEINKVSNLKKYISNELKKKLIFLGIFTKKNFHIGNIKFYHFNKKKSCVTLGIMIGEKKWRGKKILKEIIKITSPWLYMNYGIENVVSGVNNKNHYSIKGFLKSNFYITKKTSNFTYLKKSIFK